MSPKSSPCLHFIMASIIIMIMAWCAAQTDAENISVAPPRAAKFLSVFQIVTFPNDQCDGGTKNGTCYTATECSSRGGVNSGSCANGYGVCCVLTIHCGQSSSENCTYFDSMSPAPGGCSVRICPCGTNICQLRLDFANFVIAGPTTTSTSYTKMKNGVVSATGDTVSANSQCLTDTFSVTGGSPVPLICGTNTGHHVYVDATPACNCLAFQLGGTGIGAVIPTRSFSIKVTQYTCDYPNLAPSGCVQFFFGSNMGQVQTFNYNNGAGQHLSDQDQVICVRRERSNCRICWYTVDPADFAVSGSQFVSGRNWDSFCCSYGASLVTTRAQGYDCVMIPGAESEAQGMMVQSNICGRSKGLKAGGVVDMTVCSSRAPFFITFRSDGYEYWGPNMEASLQDKGFSLVYTMDATNC